MFGLKRKKKKLSRKSIINYNKFSVSFSKGFSVEKKKMDSFQLNRTAIRTASNHLDLFLLLLFSKCDIAFYVIEKWFFYNFSQNSLKKTSRKEKRKKMKFNPNGNVNGNVNVNVLSIT